MQVIFVVKFAKKNFKSLCFVFLFVQLLGGSAYSKDYYVSALKGNDSNPGTPAQPFKTIQHAKAIVRLQTKTQDYRVIIMSGRYEITEPMSFDSQDGGSDSYQVIYEGYDRDNPPVLDGGALVGTNGWVNEGSNIWSTDVASGWMFRRLYADGVRQIRSREPDFDLNAGVVYGTTYIVAQDDPIYSNGVVRLINSPSNIPQVVSFESTDRSSFNVSLEFPDVSPSDHAEIVTFSHWNSTRAPLACVSNDLVTASNRVGLSSTSDYHMNLITGSQFFLEHAESFLDTEGEWWLDYANHRLYYFSADDPATKNFWAPHVSQLLQIDGGTTNTAVQNLEFHHLVFQGVNWQLPADSCIGKQADYYYDINQELHRMPAAVSVKNANQCGFYDCTIMNVTANGLAMESGSQDCFVDSCLIWDTGAGGVIAGVAYGLGDDTSGDIRISNNLITDCGNDYLGAQGVWVNYVPNVQVTDNTVCDTGYTGISMGFNWLDGVTRQTNGLVRGNNVFGMMKYAFDGAGIYIVGNQGGGTVSENFVHDAPNAKGLHCDQGSSYVVLSNNLIKSCYIGLALNSGHDRLVKNNIFYDLEYTPITVNQKLFTNQTTVCFYNNIIEKTPAKAVFMMNTSGDTIHIPVQAEINSNLYYDCDLPNSTFSLIGWGGTPTNWLEWSVWKSRGYDENSMLNTNDPGFVDPDNDDFRFQDVASVSSLIGFSDWRKCDEGSSLAATHEYPVVWTNIVGVDVDGSSLIKSSGTTGWNAGAFSTKSGLSDVGIRFVALETNAARMCGLSEEDVDSDYTSINFAWQLAGDGVIRIYESGTNKGVFGQYASGDTFDIERVGCSILYKHNDVVKRIATNALPGRLSADCSLGQLNSTIEDAMFYCPETPISWINVSTGIAVTNNSLKKISGTTGWNAGACSAEARSGDIGICFSALETNASRMCGLSTNDIDENYTSINFAWQLSTDGILRIYESGANRGVMGSYVSGDTFSVERFNDMIVYRHNGQIIRTVSGVTTDALVADCSLSQLNSTISDAIWVENVADYSAASGWTNITGASISGHSLIKTADVGWGNAGASSADVFSGDVGVCFTSLEIGKYWICGLSTNDVNANYDTIDYAWYLWGNGTKHIYENGVNRWDGGSYSAGDLFAVERIGATVYYLYNGTRVWTNSNATAGPLSVDCSLYSTDSAVRDVISYHPD